MEHQEWVNKRLTGLDHILFGMASAKTPLDHIIFGMASAKTPNEFYKSYRETVTAAFARATEGGKYCTLENLLKELGYEV